MPAPDNYLFATNILADGKHCIALCKSLFTYMENELIAIDPDTVGINQIGGVLPEQYGIGGICDLTICGQWVVVVAGEVL